MRPPEPGATRSRYSGGAILFHWVIAILIVANIAVALVTDDWEGPARASAMGFHKATGLTVLVLSLLRVAWRLLHRPPPFPAGISRLEAITARTVHWLFYALMIVMPLTGWLMTSASTSRKPFSWYGFFELPFLPVQGNKAVGGFAHEAHEILGYALIGLIILHLLAALKHHFIGDARLIWRMWPRADAARR